MNQPGLFDESEPRYSRVRHNCGEVLEFVRGSVNPFCPRCGHRPHARTVEPINDPVLGKARGEAGMGAVIAFSYEDWKEQFERNLLFFASTRRPFTSEDITEEVGLPQGGGSLKNNVVGALMNAAAKKGLIRKTGSMGVSRAPRSHGREIRLWVGI